MITSKNTVRKGDGVVRQCNVCMYENEGVILRASIYVCLCASVSACMDFSLWVCAYLRLCVRMRVCENICYVCLCEDALLCVSVHVHSYRTHTHICAHSQIVGSQDCRFGVVYFTL